jgi:hypothetical protein
MRNSHRFIALALALLPACGDDPETGVDPDLAPRASIDRFSEAAGTLMVRDGSNGLPAANAPIDFDQGPFVTTGLGPAGDVARYYNFDVQPTAPAPIYVFFRDGEDAPVAGQLNVVDVIPGDAGYNDFWQVVRVTVDDDYVANHVTSAAEIIEHGYPTDATSTLVNCPIVPEGSTATLRLSGDPGLTRGWYRGEVVSYFHFGEAPLATLDTGAVPTSPIYVTFNTNPDQPGGGPPSGFVTEPGTDQTHNVVATVPGEPGYSPLWAVHIYDNGDFDAVADLASAQAATLLVEGAANVNCPLVAREDR